MSCVFVEKGGPLTHFKQEAFYGASFYFWVVFGDPTPQIAIVCIRNIDRKSWGGTGVIIIRPALGV